MAGQRWDVMMVREYQDGQGQQRSFWTKIGAAFTNKDGSIGVQLDALPMDGKVILQIPLSKEEIAAKRQGAWNPQQRSGHGNPHQQQRGGGGQQQRGGFGNGGRGQQQQQQQRGGGGGSQAQRYQQQQPPPYPSGEDDFPPETGFAPDEDPSNGPPEGSNFGTGNEPGPFG